MTLFARAGSSVPGVTIESLDVPESVRPANFSLPNQERPVDAGFFAQSNIFLQLFLTLQRRYIEFDLIHAHAFDWPAFVCSALVSSLPVLHTLHLPALSPEINDALHVLDQQGHPLTLITVSSACARTYAPYTKMDAVTYNGLDVQAIPFAAEVAADAPLLFAGRIAPEKGVEAAIEIALRANQRLLLAGGIYDQDYYEQRILPALKRAGERVTFLGQLEHAELWRLMSQARGLLFPIAWDAPFGLTAVEAMAAGTPVIAFHRGAAGEIIRHGETGFLVPPGNIAEAAAYVKELPRLARSTCRRHVEQNFSFERMLDEYEQMYAKAIHLEN